VESSLRTEKLHWSKRQRSSTSLQFYSNLINDCEHYNHQVLTLDEVRQLSIKIINVSTVTFSQLRTLSAAVTTISSQSGNRVSTSLSNRGLCWTVFARNRDTVLPAEGNDDIQTLICVLVARPRRCLTLSNPVPWQNWIVAYLGYTLQMKTLFRGWPVMVHDTHTRRRRLPYQCQHWNHQPLYSFPPSAGHRPRQHQS